MRLLWLVLAIAALAAAQSNQLQLCDQQGATACIVWTAPANLSGVNLFQQIPGTDAKGVFYSDGAGTIVWTGSPTLAGATVTSGSGDCVKIDPATVYSLAGCVTGHTLWAVAKSGGDGILRLSDGTGAGGLDGNGAQILLTGSSGIGQAIEWVAGNTGSNHTFANANGNFLVDGDGNVGAQSVTAASTIQSNAIGAAIAFQTTSPFNFQVNGNGVVSTAGGLNLNQAAILDGSGANPVGTITCTGAGCAVNTCTGIVSTDTRGCINSSGSGAFTITVPWAVTHAHRPNCSVSSSGTTAVPFSYASPSTGNLVIQNPSQTTGQYMYVCSD